MLKDYLTNMHDKRERYRLILNT